MSKSNAKIKKVENNSDISSEREKYDIKLGEYKNEDEFFENWKLLVERQKKLEPAINVPTILTTNNYDNCNVCSDSINKTFEHGMISKYLKCNNLLCEYSNGNKSCYCLRICSMTFKCVNYTKDEHYLNPLTKKNDEEFNKFLKNQDDEILERVKSNLKVYEDEYDDFPKQAEKIKNLALKFRDKPLHPNTEEGQLLIDCTKFIQTQKKNMLDDFIEIFMRFETSFKEFDEMERNSNNIKHSNISANSINTIANEETRGKILDQGQTQDLPANILELDVVKYIEDLSNNLYVDENNNLNNETNANGIKEGNQKYDIDVRISDSQDNCILEIKKADKVEPTIKHTKKPVNCSLPFCKTNKSEPHDMIIRYLSCNQTTCSNFNDKKNCFCLKVCEKNGKCIQYKTARHSVLSNENNMSSIISATQQHLIDAKKRHERFIKVDMEKLLEKADRVIKEHMNEIPVWKQNGCERYIRNFRIDNWNWVEVNNWKVESHFELVSATEGVLKKIEDSSIWYIYEDRCIIRPINGQPETIHGSWLKGDEMKRHLSFKLCSLCKKVLIDIKILYCQDCETSGANIMYTNGIEHQNIPGFKITPNHNKSTSVESQVSVKYEVWKQNGYGLYILHLKNDKWILMKNSLVMCHLNFFDTKDDLVILKNIEDNSTWLLNSKECINNTISSQFKNHYYGSWLMEDELKSEKQCEVWKQTGSERYIRNFGNDKWVEVDNFEIISHFRFVYEEDDQLILEKVEDGLLRTIKIQSCIINNPINGQSEIIEGSWLGGDEIKKHLSFIICWMCQKSIINQDELYCVYCQNEMETILN